MYCLKCNPKFFYATKKHFPVKKCILLLDLSILQKSKVTNNLITILGYSNDKNIYIYMYCEEYYFDWQVDSLYKIRHVQPTDSKV